MYLSYFRIGMSLTRVKMLWLNLWDRVRQRSSTREGFSSGISIYPGGGIGSNPGDVGGEPAHHLPSVSAKQRRLIWTCDNQDTGTVNWALKIQEARAISSAKGKDPLVVEVNDTLVIKQDGQKRDDAEVPVNLWGSHLEQTLTPGLGTLSGPWKRSMAPIQSFLLRCWTQIVLRSFLRYRAHRMPASLVPASQGQHWVKRQGGIYVWTTGGRLGYSSWMSRIWTHPSTKPDVEAARECIKKCCGATWWDWSSGSRLLFWN